MTSPDPLWSDIVSTALVGTGRRAFTPPAAPEPWGNLLARLPADQPEHALLAAAGTVALVRLAGARPRPLPARLPEPSPHDQRPRCRPGAAHYLARLLAGEHAAALPEWLSTAAAARQRVPEMQLPGLLQSGVTQPHLRPAILRVIGERGRWLAAHNSAWDYAAVAVPTTVTDEVFDRLKPIWETGSRAQRLSLLEQLRQADARRARALARSTWEQEKAEDRAAALERLRPRLSLADEEFLETALDDRSREVRRVAADLLAHLAGSQLCQRMLARVQPLVRVRSGRRRRLPFGSQPQLLVELPKACDAAMQRDGVEPRPPRNLGEKAWWLQQMLAAVPPAAWSEALACTPAEIIGLARATEWAEVLLAGWSQATVRHGDAEWAEALLSEQLRVRKSLPIMPLVPALPPERREAFVFDFVSANPRLEPDQPAHWLLAQHREAWSLRLSRLVVECLRGWLNTAAATQPRAGLNGWLKDWARWLHPALVDEAGPLLIEAAEARADWPGWLSAIDEALALWRFRHAMLKELTA